MTGTPDAGKDREERLHALLQSCLQAIAAGQAPDPHDVLHQHPEFARELTAFFADRAQQTRLTQLFRRDGKADADATLPPGPPSPDDAAFTLKSQDRFQRAEDGSTNRPLTGLGSPGHGADPDVTLPPDTGTTLPGFPDISRQFGDYELLQEIARGGMGVVFKARQISINRLVALKMILAGQLASEAQVQRFHTEAKAAGHLDHPNIVPIYEVNQHGGHIYYSMKLVEGCSLAQFLTNLIGTAGTKDISLPSILSARQVDSARLISTVARAIHHAHQRGILHRDLKPANILLQMRGAGDDDKTTKVRNSVTPSPLHLVTLSSSVPMVADFGLAKQVEADDGLTQSGTIVGTPSYMAPEQARAEKGLTTATDVYSLGAILFEMLTGRPPFQAATTLQTVLQVLEKDPVTPRSLNRHIDPDLETICLKCLEKDPGKRYGSAEELAQDLDRWLAGEPILARPVSGSERLWRWCRRKPVVAGLVLAVALSLLGGIGVSTYFAIVASHRADDAEREKLRADQKTELANDYLARSLFDQAHTLSRSNRPGRRQEGLHKLLEAAKLSSRVPIIKTRPIDSDVSGLSAKLPTRLELRNEAVALLLAQDARLLREVRPASNSAVFLSPDGMVAAWAWYDINKARLLRNDPEGSREGCEVTELASGKTVRWETPLTAAHAFHGAIRPDKKLVVSLKMGTEQLEFRDLWDGKIVQVLDKAIDWPTDKDTEKIGIALSPSLTFSPDGRYLAGVRKSFKRLEFALWDLKNDQARVFSREHSYRVAWVAFSATGKLLAFPSGEKTVTLWDLANDVKAQEIELPFAGTGPPSFGLGDKLIAFPCRNKDDSKPSIIVWELGKTARMRFPLSQPVTGKTLAFRPGTNLLAVGDGAHIVLIDALQGKELFRFETDSIVNQLAWQPDGGHIVSFGQKDTIKIWELSESPPLFSIQPVAERFADLEFSGDGRWLTLLAADTPRIWLIERKTGKVERELTVPIKRPTQETFGAVLIRRDGKQVTAHGWIDQDRSPTARVWDVGSGTEISSLDRVDIFHSLAFGQDNHVYAALGSPGKLAVWDVTLKKPVWESAVPSGTGSLLSPDGKFLIGFPVQNVGANHQFHLWELPEGRKRGPFPLDGIPNQLAFSADGSLLAIHHKTIDPGKGKFGESGLGVWSIPSGEKRLSWRDLSAHQLVFSPDNRLLAVLNADRFIKLLDVPTGAEIFTWQTNARDLAFTPDGAFLATIIPTATNSQEGGTAVQFLDLANLRRGLVAMGLDWDE